MKKELELYLHIPFCVRKCAYCDFLSFPAEKEIQKQYVNCLIEEIRQFDLAEDYVVSTIFFGGGTPSVLEGSEIIFCKLHQRCRRRSEKNHTFHEVKSFRFLLRIFLL